MKPDITVAEVQDKQLALQDTIQKLLMDFKNETGFYVDSINLDYYSSLSEKNAVLIVDISSRINC